MFGIPTPQTLVAKILVGVAAALLLLSAGAYTGYRYEKSALDDLKLADANAMVVATKDAASKQHGIDLGNQDDAVSEAYFRGKMDGTIISLKSGAPLNVTVTQDQQAASSDHAGCITYGFYRMLVAGERGVAPESLSLPDGQSVDACTGVEPSKLATDTAQDLAAGAIDAHQLTAVIAAIKRNDAIATGPTAP